MWSVKPTFAKASFALFLLSCLFTPDKVSELFASDLSDAMTIKMPIAGAISSDTDFDLQMEQDIPITESNMIFKNYYSSILLRMMEGA